MSHIIKVYADNYVLLLNRLTSVKQRTYKVFFFPKLYKTLLSLLPILSDDDVFLVKKETLFKLRNPSK